MAERNANIQLLAALVDWDDEEDSEYRFLVDCKDVKYVTTAPGSFPKDDRTFAPILIPLLPKFPPGDWNEGYISKDKSTGELAFTRTTTTILPEVRNNWHPTRIDHLELVKLARLRQNIHSVSHPRFPRPMVVKFAEFPWKMPQIELETAAYERINDAGIAPNFLGHVTEAGRTIGFLIDLVQGARAAGQEDLAVCQRVLSKLHGLGLRHGDINKHNFLVGNGSVVMIDFETTKECDVKEELEEEYSRLEESLVDPSYRGGIGPATVGRPL
jgi:Lipopolysaccharide kinase (Kdo/WaaP) family